MLDAAAGRSWASLKHALVAALLAAMPMSAPDAGAATLIVDVDGAAPGGSVLVALCRGGLDEAFCGEGRDAPAAGGVLRFTFDEVAPGRVAVAAFQDLNGNRRLDRTPLGLPLEPFGFSNGAGRDGRPSFAAASIDVAEPGGVVRVRLKRILRR